MSFTIRMRGAPPCFVSVSYLCADHGTWNDLVAPGTEELSCPDCGASSPRTVDAPAVHVQFAVSASRGRSDAKPHPHSMDTRPLAEGQPYGEWKKERARLWESERHRRVRALLE